MTTECSAEVVSHHRWSFIAVVLNGRFHCIWYFALHICLFLFSHVCVFADRGATAWCPLTQPASSSQQNGFTWVQLLDAIVSLLLSHFLQCFALWTGFEVRDQTAAQMCPARQMQLRFFRAFVSLLPCWVCGVVVERPGPSTVLYEHVACVYHMTYVKCLLYKGIKMLLVWPFQSNIIKFMA